LVALEIGGAQVAPAPAVDEAQRRHAGQVEAAAADL
jgi:hypothetical protein